MTRGWRGGRDAWVGRVAFGLAVAVVAPSTGMGAAEILRVAGETAAPPWLLAIGWLPLGAGTWGLVAAGLFAARRGSTGLVVALLAAACLLAWVFAPSLSTGLDETGDGWLAGWLMGYAAHAAAATMLGLYATTPGRSLGRWVKPVAAGCVAFIVMTLLLDIAHRAGLAGLDGTPGGRPTIVYYSDLWMEIGIPVIVPGVLALVGALRADARAMIRGPVVTAAGWSVPVVRWSGRRLPVFWLAASASIGALFLSLRWPPTGSFSGSYIELCLWPVAAMIARRWSPACSWLFLVAAFAAAALPPFTAAIRRSGIEMTAAALWGDPATIAASAKPLLVWIALTAVAVACGWTVLALVRPRAWVPRVAALALAIHVGVGLAALTIGRVLVVWLVTVPVPLPPLEVAMPLGAVVPLGVALVVILRRRVVEGVAEAERQPGLGFGGYLAVAAREFVTGEGRVGAVASEAERARLASDLHAEVLPGLARLRAESEAGADPGALARRIAAMEEEVRGLLAERRLVVLEELGLVEALEWLADRAEDRSAMAIELTVDDRSSDERPPRPVERAAFRVAQLAVDNAILHALAARLAIDVLVRPDEVRVRIEDDGRGLPGDGDAVAVGRAAARTNHAGLADMRAQARQVQARLDLVPAPDGGTIVSFGWAG